MLCGIVRAHGAVGAAWSGCAQEFRAYERDAHYHPQASAAAQTAVLQALSQGVYAAGRCPLGRARALLDRARLLHASFAEQPAAVDGDQRLPHLQSLDEAILALVRRHQAATVLATLLPCCSANDNVCASLEMLASHLTSP